MNELKEFIKKKDKLTVKYYVVLMVMITIFGMLLLVSEDYMRGTMLTVTRIVLIIVTLTIYFIQTAKYRNKIEALEDKYNI